MDLEVRQHERFTRNEWCFNRVGWGVIAVFVLAGLVGLLGPGPLSWTTQRGAAGLVEVEYQRIGHLEADDLLTVTVDPEAVTGDSVTVVLAPEWIESVDISRIRPAPDSETSTPAGLELEFATQPGAQLNAQITFRAQEMGSVAGSASIDDDAVSFNQLILP